MEKFIKQGQIIVGLDFDNSQSALEITKFLNPENYKVKVGNQLFTACGPQILEDLKMQGFDIFLDFLGIFGISGQILGFLVKIR